MLRVQLALLAALACLALLSATGYLGFLRDEFPERRRRWLATAFLLGILTACVFFPAVSPDQAANLEPETIWFPALFLGHALITVFLLVWWMLRGDISLSRFLHLDPLLPSDVNVGLFLGSMGWVATMVAAASVAGLLSTRDLAPEGPDVPQFMFWIAQLPLGKKLIIIAVAMTMEEAFFRGFLQSRIGLIPSSLLFVLSHASYGLPLMLVAVLVISLVIGWSFRQTGRLLPCIIAHGVFDGIQLLLIMPWAARMLEQEELILTVLRTHW